MMTISANASANDKSSMSEEAFSEGYALMQQYNFDASIKAFERSIKLEPKNAKAYYHKGMALEELGRHEEVVAAYDEATAPFS